MGIRSKFLLAVMASVLVLLGVAILSLRVLGHRYYLTQHGVLFQTIASSVAAQIEQGLVDHAEHLRNCLTLAKIAGQVEQLAAGAEPQLPSDFSNSVAEVEALWKDADQDHPLIASILDNPVSRQIRALRSLSPLLAEVFVTDRQGRVIAASNKTSDYWQADERWWQKAHAITNGKIFVQGIHYDQSAGIYSLDMAMPIRKTGGKTPETVGILKAVLNASPLLQSLAPIADNRVLVQEVVLDDGPVLVRFSGDPVVPLSEHVTPESSAALSAADSGSSVMKLFNDTPLLTGHAPLRFTRAFPHPKLISDISPMHVLVHEDLATVLAPVKAQTLKLAFFGTVVMLVLGLGGYFMASRKLLRPMMVLRSAAQGISSSAKLGGPQAGRFAQRTGQQPEDLIRQVKAIRTHDEIEELARDFALMAERVINYHRQMEHELTSKTEELQQDLAMAREFQQALLPAEYPRIPEPPARAAARLEFSHLYKPAASVGGDFFEVTRLSAYSAGIFVADVMGHGPRSALVTAILHTLLSSGDPDDIDPGRIIDKMNSEIYSLASRTENPLFVTAVHMVMDTRASEVRFCVAGHPPPMVADRSSKTVSQLLSTEDTCPALGLFKTIHSRTITRPMNPGTTYLLYTDGVIEARDPRGDEFGRERLAESIVAGLRNDVDSLPAAIYEDVGFFMDTAQAEDDICLLATDVINADE